MKNKIQPQFKRAILLLVLSAFAFVARGQNAPAQTNVAGTWKIDMAKSDLGIMYEGSISKVLHITQQPGEIIINRNALTHKGTDTVVNDTLLLNGHIRTSVYHSEASVYTYKVKDTYSADGSITRTTNIHIASKIPMDALNTDKYSISADKKTLTIESLSIYDNRKDKSVLVYQKQ